MTIASTTRKAGPYIGDAVVTALPFAFKVFTAADVLVVQAVTATGVETTKTLNTDYTVALNADQNASPGGMVNMVAAAPVGTTTTLASQVALSQGTDLTNAGGFYPKVINDALDRATIQIQQLAEKVARAVGFPVSDATLTTTLPSASKRANKALIFDPTGNVAVSVDNYVDQLANVTAQAAIATAGAGTATAQAGIATAQAAAAAASKSAIDAKYRGTLGADPATRPDGSANQAGDWYTTTAGAAKVYVGGVWAVVTGASAVDLADSADTAKGAALVGFAGESVYTAIKTNITRAVELGNRARALVRTVYGRDTLPLVASKLHVPSLTLTDLASAANLSVHASGGIVATTAGVTGTGKITLPSAIDPSKPFRVHALIELNGDAANNLFLQLGSTGTPPFWSGTRFSVIKQSGLNGNMGNTTMFNALGDTGSGGPAIPNGTQFWINICGDGQRVTTSVVPNIAAASFATTWWQRCAAVFRPQYNVVNWADEATSDVSSGAGQYTWGRVGQADQLTQLYFTSTSTTTRLIGVYCNIGEMDGPGDTRLGAPVAMALSNSQDNDGIGATCPFVLLPPYWGCPGQRDFVMQHHPNGNSGTFLMSNSGPTALAIYAGGYGQGVVTGCQAAGDFAGATSSNWGAPTGLQYRKNFLDYVRNAFRADGKLIHLGLSMGLMNSLAYFREYGEGDAIVGVSGACDLTDSSNNRGFAAIIAAGYGAWYESLADANTGNLPESSPTLWRRINRGAGPTGLKSLLSPHNWRNLYAGGTAYAKSDVVYRPFTGGIAALAAYDPTLTPKLFAGLPIKLWHGSADVTIPATHATNFVAAVNKYGAAASSVSVVGGGHLDATMWGGTVPADIVAFMDALS